MTVKSETDCIRSWYVRYNESFKADENQLSVLLGSRKSKNRYAQTTTTCI